MKMRTGTIRTYSELIKLSTIQERFDYLVLNGKVAEDTFGAERYLNQSFYHSYEWRKLRNDIILRDNGCDLAVPGFEIQGFIYVHHMNPLSLADLKGDFTRALNPEFLICCSYNTHQAITYGLPDLLPHPPIERRPNDEIPWK